MKRIILALLALLGLVAQSAPLQARMCGADSAQIGVMVAPRAQGQALGANTATTESAANKADKRERNCSAPVERRRPVYLPSVQLGSDRALE